MRVSTASPSTRVRDPEDDRPTAWSGLATKLILFVFASTFITATVVSWISIQSTSGSLRSMIERLYPLSLVPLFIGPPLGILTHVCSLWNLSARASSSVSAPASVATPPSHRRSLSGAIRTT